MPEESEKRIEQEGAEFTIYRCTECGEVKRSVALLHVHIEAKHTGFGPFNLIPDLRAHGDFEADMEKTEVIRVTDYYVDEEGCWPYER